MSSGLARRSVSTAVMTKTRSPHTIGEALLLPGKSTFHLMFVFASQVIGGSAVGETPVASGPRQWAQLSAGSAKALAVMVSRISATRRIMWISAIHVLFPLSASERGLG